ncbi:MAG: hypothetical protein U0T83_05810 [Bacteriovoracaceae bacterium]
MKLFISIFSLLLSISVLADCRGKLMKQERFEAATPEEIKTMLINTKFTALKAAKDRAIASISVGESADKITNIKLVVYSYCYFRCYENESLRNDHKFVTSTITTTSGVISEEDGPLGSERCRADHPLPRP